MKERKETQPPAHAAAHVAVQMLGLEDAAPVASSSSGLTSSDAARPFASRSATKVFWKVGALGNLLLLGVVLGSAVVQLAIHHVPWTQTLFQIGELSAADCAIAFVLGLVPVTVLELVKLARFGIDGARGGATKEHRHELRV